MLRKLEAKKISCNVARISGWSFQADKLGRYVACVKNWPSNWNWKDPLERKKQSLLIIMLRKYSLLHTFCLRFLFLRGTGVSLFRDSDRLFPTTSSDKFCAIPFFFCCAVADVEHLLLLALGIEGMFLAYRDEGIWESAENRQTTLALIIIILNQGNCNVILRYTYISLTLFQIVPLPTFGTCQAQPEPRLIYLA